MTEDEERELDDRLAEMNELTKRYVTEVDLPFDDHPPTREQRRERRHLEAMGLFDSPVPPWTVRFTVTTTNRRQQVQVGVRSVWSLLVVLAILVGVPLLFALLGWAG